MTMHRTDIGTSAIRSRLDPFWQKITAGDPITTLFLFIGMNAVIWALLPTLLHRGPPMDMTEGYAISKEWVLGTHKHPALPYWLLEASRWLTGAVGWPAYILSTLFVAATYAIVFQLGRDMMGPQRALWGTLLLIGVIYFSWVIPEFNHNVAQMPVWVGLIWALWRARENGRAGWWIAVGVLGAMGLYIKLTMGILLLTAAGYILVDQKCRRQIATVGPWLGLAAFLALTAPLVLWLLKTNFQMVEYAQVRIHSSRTGSIALFLLKHFAATIGFWILLLAVLSKRPLASQSPEGSSDAVRPDVTVFLAVFLLTPVLISVSAAAFAGSGLKASWSAPMHSLMGLLVVALLSEKMSLQALIPRLTAGAMALTMIIPAAYAGAVLYTNRFSSPPPRTNWPQNKIASDLNTIWRTKTGKPLQIVIGDTWVGGMVSALAPDRPSLLVDGQLALSPWVDPAMLAKEGALVVWWSSKSPTAASILEFTAGRSDGQFEIGGSSTGRKKRATIYYGFVSPDEATRVIARQKSERRPLHTVKRQTPAE